MKIILDNKEVPELVPASLPMLVHGHEGSGASMYTIALAAKWFTQGREIKFLCGYPMAEKEFTTLVGEHKSAIFYTQEKIEQFKQDVINSDALVVIKNIELFGVDVIKAINTKLFIVSGDFSKCSFKEELDKIPFASEVYFSQLNNKELPPLKKYEGLVISGEFQGLTRLE